MQYNRVIEGRYVILRSISLEDADFSLMIRQDKKKNKYIHAVENDLEKQKVWIKNQLERENDYFFIVEDLKDNKIGTVGVYNIKDNIGELGRLVMTGNPFQSFEAIILICRFAYDVLGLESLLGYVAKENIASLNISKAIGMHFSNPQYDEELGMDYMHGITYKTEFDKYEQGIKELIYR